MSSSVLDRNKVNKKFFIQPLCLRSQSRIPIPFEEGKDYSPIRFCSSRFSKGGGKWEGEFDIPIPPRSFPSKMRENVVACHWNNWQVGNQHGSAGESRRKQFLAGLKKFKWAVGGAGILVGRVERWIYWLI